MRESAIEAACCRYARARKCKPVKLQAGETGMPDRLFLLPKGRLLLVEFKAPGEHLSPRQRLVSATLGDIGHPVFVIRSTGLFKELLDGLLGVV